ncbi:MAG TPA: hypothetical protein VFD64_17530 [Gemmatimonadaceae bacterium]|nr:hypothetical protein [Gemmatimonadaceae bacterium]
MRRSSVLFVAVGMVAAGCSRDAPIVAPDIEVAEAMVAQAKAVETTDKDRLVADAIDDALERLIPSLDNYGIPLRAPLIALQTRASDPSAWDALGRALKAITPTLPEEYRPDLDALRLQLGAAATQ